MFDMRSLTQGRARWMLVFVVLVYALVFQGSRPLYSPDEGRYTDVALVMLDSGDWVRPMLNDEFEHWSKPPLTYWSIATSIKLLGHNEFAARLPSALAFALTILLLVRLGRHFTAEQPALPAVIYATFLFPAIASNQVTTDSLLTLWETLQITAFASLWWSARPADETKARLLLWLGAALAFMTKGPPGLLLLAASAVFAVSSTGWRGLLRIFRWDGLLLFVILGGSWFAAVVYQQPDLLHYFLVDEVVDRVATSKFHRNGQWYGAFKIYLPVLVLGTLPWLAIAASRIWKNRKTLLHHIRESAESRLVACWIVVPLLAFAISRSRLPLYILPVFVPIAIALARVIQPLNLTALSRRIALAVWCAVIILARIVPAHLNTAADDKRLARDLSKHLPESPHEILFVETAPRFGLRFYLRSEIERIELPDGSARPESEEIASEMHTSEGCRVLLTKPDSADRLEASLNTHKVEFRRLPNVRGYAVFKQISADCPAYGRLSQTHVNSRKTDARGILVATLARGSYRISP